MFNNNNFQTYNDGKWHTVELAMSKNYAVLSIDNEKAETKRILDISTGPYYMIGGGIYGQKGFIGYAFLLCINIILHFCTSGCVRSSIKLCTVHLLQAVLSQLAWQH